MEFDVFERYRSGGTEGGLAVLPSEEEDDHKEIDEHTLDLLRNGADERVQEDLGRTSSQPDPPDPTEPVHLDASSGVWIEPIELVPRYIHEVAGEPFFLEREDGYIYLSHIRWSLTGAGKSLLEAEQDLIEDARLKAEIYLSHPVEQMTYDAFEMGNFILRLLSDVNT